MAIATDDEIKQKGMMVLVDALGEVDAERFITLLNREPFDYTGWQRNLFNDTGVEKLSQLAMKARKEK